ncbi:autotransporter domain-containing protein [Helicobacter labetoulli]
MNSACKAHLAILIGYQKLYFKPFVGLYYTLGLQGNMAESSTSNAPTLWFQSQQNHSVFMLLGGEARYYFGRHHILFGSVNLQYNLMPTPQTTAYIGSSPLYFDTQKSLGYTLHLGGSVPLHKNISLSLYALYAQSHTQFKTYSGTFNLSYYF